MNGLRRAKWLRWLTLGLVLVICGSWLLYNLNLRTTLTILQRADTIKILLYLPLLMLAGWTIRAVRWGVVLRSAGVTIEPLPLYLSIGAALGLEQ